MLAVLETSRLQISVEVFPCKSKTDAIDKERQLIEHLKPKFNTAPQAGGWKGMHTASGLEAIRKATTGRPVTDAQRAARRKTMQTLNDKRYGHAPEV